MTRKISVTVPDEIGDYLDEQPNTSAEVTDALMVRVIARRTAKVIADAGYDVTEEGMTRMRSRLDTLHAQRAARAQTA